MRLNAPEFGTVALESHCGKEKEDGGITAIPLSPVPNDLLGRLKKSNSVARLQRGKAKG